MMIKRHIVLILPIASFWIWTYWLRDCGYFYMGSAFPQSTCVLLALVGLDVLLFLLSMTAILFCLGQLFLLFLRKKFNKYVFILNAMLIVSFILVFQIKPDPYFVPFALGLKNYYAKEVNLHQFQQWIESSQINEFDMLLSEPYDTYNFPAVLLDDLRKLRAVRVAVKQTASGASYLRLWSYKLFIGDYGFVVGANKDEWPSEKYAPEEHRVEIDNRSFEWISERP